MANKINDRSHSTGLGQGRRKALINQVTTEEIIEVKEESTVEHNHVSPPQYESSVATESEDDNIKTKTLIRLINHLVKLDKKVY
jgi:hypothetical protein